MSRLRWIVLCYIAVAVSACSGDPPASDTKAHQEAIKASKPKEPSIGDEVEIVLSGSIADAKDGSTMFVRAVRPEAWDDYSRFAAAKDEVGLQLLWDKKSAYLIENGTKAKILGKDDAGYDVRMREGQFVGVEFWVLKQSVKQED